MFIDDPVRLHHMLDAAKEAVLFAENRTRIDLESDRMLTLSLVKCIEIIGEAAAWLRHAARMAGATLRERMTKERQQELPQIPWPQIISMRNRLIHAYFEIDLDAVWDTVTEDIPVLIVELEQIITESE
ncbi:MAG: DUF86 domain-containing protein [Hormoscilla sp. GM7CHS1pb]|nr:DUF86 domain-containing protein [Hormoscilla sp. GM7CHS1pb]